jgi:hypothetical protein
MSAKKPSNEQIIEAARRQMQPINVADYLNGTFYVYFRSGENGSHIVKLSVDQVNAVEVAPENVDERKEYDWNDLEEARAQAYEKGLADARKTAPDALQPIDADEIYDFIWEWNRENGNVIMDKLPFIPFSKAIADRYGVPKLKPITLDQVQEIHKKYQAAMKTHHDQGKYNLPTREYEELYMQAINEVLGLA